MKRGERPQSKEAYKKVKDALELVRAGKRKAVIRKHVTQTLDFLEVTSTADIWEPLEELLTELLRVNPYQHYEGAFPPAKSYEPEMMGCELWAYSWDSPSRSCKAYLKFGIYYPYKKTTKKRDQLDGWLFLCTCHESTKTNG